jgi:hypothetical protein
MPSCPTFINGLRPDRPIENRPQAESLPYILRLVGWSNMWRGISFLLLSLCCAAQVRGLPAGAVVIETKDLPASVHANRALVLWMEHPKKNDRGPLTDENIYTCPEQTLGSYYEGPTRISLVDTQTKSIVNTIHVGSGDSDSFNLPYRIKPGPYYHVTEKLVRGEGKPELLYLRDYNGDGQALEAAFFEAEACMGLATTLIGYSQKQDKVIRYRTILQTSNGKQLELEWVDYLFSEKPVRPGYWKYEIDYRGRAGTLDRYEVRYDPGAEVFRGALSSSK